ncbi:hypothetical protein [uncultured Paraglaciecola sp.]|uniref:hypothetical protein n=1 Tax=uncultured Paraglaciecola sp. TaxID=1765024 RepID=UPI0026123AED|nr:hypothetical protein [uncultured Paraglaciecola sp.]
MKKIIMSAFLVSLVTAISACTSPLTIHPMSPDNAFQIKRAQINARFSVGLTDNGEDKES